MAESTVTTRAFYGDNSKRTNEAWQQKMSKLERCAREFGDHPILLKRRRSRPGITQKGNSNPQRKTYLQFMESQWLTKHQLLKILEEEFSFDKFDVAVPNTHQGRQLLVKDVHVFAKEKVCDGKCAYIVATLPYFWHIYTRICSPEDRNYYEVIPEGAACRLYFDLEFKTKFNPQKDGASMVDIFIRGLELIPKDTWATHALAHVLEMEGRQDEGIEFMSKTMENWKPCESLACHNFWHWALYYIEKGDYEAALNIFDTEMVPRFKASATFQLTDGSSLLYRLKFEGVDVGDRWQQLCQYWESHADDHFLAFNDSHMLMSTLGAKNEDLTMKLLDSLRKYVRDGSGPNCEVSRTVGLAICQAFLEADKGKFDKAVALLKPLRYKVDLMGGSRAQRDVYELFLINAAMHSKRKEDHQFARCLIVEKKAKKNKSPMADRLMAQALALHVE